MRPNKQGLFTGIALLTIGIFLRILVDPTWPSYIFIALGVCFKVFYIAALYKTGNYKPGLEMLALIVGLTLFSIGLILKYSTSDINPYLFIAPGIMFKLTFIILFIAKLRKQSGEA